MGHVLSTHLIRSRLGVLSDSVPPCSGLPAPPEHPEEAQGRPTLTRDKGLAGLETCCPASPCEADSRASDWLPVTSHSWHAFSPDVQTSAAPASRGDKINIEIPARLTGLLQREPPTQDLPRRGAPYGAAQASRPRRWKAPPWGARSSLRLTSIELVMPSSHLILCHFLQSEGLSRVFSNTTIGG